MALAHLISSDTANVRSYRDDGTLAFRTWETVETSL
jgi:hypothetical protein